MNAKEKIKSLRNELAKHNHAYYVLDKPTISDLEFDNLLRELNDLEKDYPQFYDKNSPTLRIGGDVLNDFKAIPHKYNMLSLANTYSSEELLLFDKRIRKLVDQPFNYVCELKYDGVSISLTYRSGELVQALTRGDGNRGDDVTSNIRTIKSVPLRLRGDFPEEFEIRGEVFLPLVSFNKINESRKKQGLVLYSNPRNTASGSLKLLNPKEVAKRSLDCFLYHLLSDRLPTNSHFDNLQKSRQWGFKIASETEVFNDIKGVVSFINKWDEKRHDLPFEIDGIVIKVDNIDLQQEMGSTAKSPRWAVSYKFKAQQLSTILESITYQVGRTGAITPVANLKPILLAGTVVKRASLHNKNQIERLDVRIGDTVFIEKGGEIIPKVVGVNMKNRNLFSIPVEYIKYCPHCNTQLVRKLVDTKHYCPNSKSCFPQIRGSFEHFISRKAMNIDGLGSETIELLIKEKLIKDISDLYLLKRSDLLKLDRMADKSVDNLLLAIIRSKSTPFYRVLFGLGIRYVGESVSKVLVKNFKTVDNLISEDINGLVKIDEIGDKIAQSVVNWFSNQKNLELIRRLQSMGLQFTAHLEDALMSTRLKGMKIVISGTFKAYSRQELRKIIEVHAGKVTSSISKNTTFVLAGDNMGPNKKQKAEDLGVLMINENEFLKKID